MSCAVIPPTGDLKQVAAFELPSSDVFEKEQGLPAYPPAESTAKGYVGAIVRAIKGIPPCIWVINQDDDEITVVVSKYRPNRILTGGGIGVSSNGGCFDLSTTIYNAPATKKTLTSQFDEREKAIAVFPLWTREDGFAVISIFTGKDKVLFIENDRVEAGSTVYFRGKPDLDIVPYNKADERPGN